MYSSTQHRVRSKDTDFEYRLVWLSSFVLVLPTLIIKRLMPTQWKRWAEGKSVFSVVRDARKTANVLAGMAYKGR